MVANMVVLVVLSFLPSTLAATPHSAPQLSLVEDTKPRLTLTSMGQRTVAVAEMGRVFARSEETQRASMAAISARLTLPKALDVLQQSSHVSSSTLKHVTN